MDTGPFFSGTIRSPAGLTMKGMAVRLGEQGEAAICYDTELLRVSTGWTGDFLTLDPARYGLIVPPVVAGDVTFQSPAIPGVSSTGDFTDPRPHKPWGPLPRDRAHYRGLYRHGNRVVLSYRVGNCAVLESPWLETLDDIRVITRTLQIAPHAEPIDIVVADAKPQVALVAADSEMATIQRRDDLTVLSIKPRSQTSLLKVLIGAETVARERFDRLVGDSKPPQSLDKWTKPGRQLWTAPIVTRGEVSPKHSAYVVDTLTLPFDNPYRALMFASGHDFFSNGDAAVCTVHGDVWRVSGIDAELRELTWKRFATGLHQPLGLKIRDDRVYVLGRDQITILHDHNNDGEADYYENFNNEGQVTSNAHEYVTGLEVDAQGNFYYLKGDSGSQTEHDGCVLRVSADGQKLEVFATGFRNANGMSLGPDGTLTVAPQEGNWTPASGIFEVQAGGFYGAMQSHHRASPPTDYQRPLCWIPRLQDNSSGGQVWAPQDGWGPMSNHLLHLSYGTSRLLLVLREHLDGVTQGGTLTLPLRFRSGVMRGRIRPTDGQVYVSGLRGWASNAAEDGCFQRIRYTGRPADLPVNMKTYRNGIALTFSRPLQRNAAEDPDNYHVQRWNYLWSEAYGSPEFKVSQPLAEGRDEVDVLSATLLPDERTVFLELVGMQPVSQLGIQMSLQSVDATPIQQTFYATIHALGTSSMAEELLTRKSRPGQLSPELRGRLEAGLVFEFSQDGDSATVADARVSRLAALSVPAETAATPFLVPGAFRLAAHGYMRTPLKGEYAFRIVGNGQATLVINDQVVISPTNTVANESGEAPVSVMLHKGFNALRIEYHSPANGNADFRVLWSGDGIAEEPLRPVDLFHDAEQARLHASRKLRRGRELFAERHCASCHATETGTPFAGSPLLEISADTPRLDGAGDRFELEWIVQWLLNPRHVRNDATMPAVLDKRQPQSVRAQEAVDLAAYLATLSARRSRNGSGSSSSDQVEEIDGDVQRGELLYENLGCIACHRFDAPEESDIYDRSTLHFVGSKFQAGQLAEFLRQPHKHFAWSRMPDFALSEQEAHDLEAFLRVSTKGQIAHSSATVQGDARRGAQLFGQRHCGNCHQVGEPRRNRPVTQAPLHWGTPVERGCLAADADQRRSGVNLQLTAPERTAVLLFLARDEQSLKRSVPAEDAETLVRRLNCAACHVRDAERSDWPEIFVEEGSTGKLPEPVPSLTWAGEKLHARWMRQFVGGETRNRPRPWLQIRMPGFGGYAPLLAEGLAAQHGIRTDESGESGAAIHDERLVEIGKRLTFKNGGLDCRQCHAVGADLPTGGKGANVAPGINFSLTRQRMRHDFYQRYTLDPPRYEVGTKMPKLAADGKSTNARGVFDGDAKRQFHAIWQYLQTPPPAPTIGDGLGDRRNGRNDAE